MSQVDQIAKNLFLNSAKDRQENHSFPWFLNFHLVCGKEIKCTFSNFKKNDKTFQSKHVF